MFTEGEDQNPGQNPVAVLGYKTWVEQFGSNPSLAGTQMVVSSQLFTIIGIAPDKFRGMTTVGAPDQLWIPSSMLEVVQRGLTLAAG